MPGIVGLITRMPPEQAEAELRRMVDSLRHEAFYEAGIWLDHSLGVYIGWIARQGSGSEAMPLYNERGDVGLVFSGEDYPEPGLVQSLKARGHEVAPARWAYLVHASEEDPAFPAGLNGRFHGLLIDRTRKTAMLFNDRYGMHRRLFPSGQRGLLLRRRSQGYPRSAFGTAYAGFSRFRRIGCDRPCVAGSHDLQWDSRIAGGGGLAFRRWLAYSQGEVFSRPRVGESNTAGSRILLPAPPRRLFAQSPEVFQRKRANWIALTGGLDTRAIMAWRKPKPARSLVTHMEVLSATAKMFKLHDKWPRHVDSLTT